MSKILKKLSYLDFPENSRQALQYVASCYSDGSTHHGLSIPGLESASENWAYEVCHEYIYFHSSSRRAAQKLNAVQELQLLEMLSSCLSEANEGSRYSIFNAIFGGSPEGYKIILLTKLVSMALSLGVGPVLDCAALWMQEHGCHSKASCDLAHSLVEDYCLLFPEVSTTFQGLPRISPLFTCNFITAVATIYPFDGNAFQKPPPLSLLRYITTWVSSDPCLCSESVRLSRIQANFSCPFMGLVQWCILGHLYTHCKVTNEAEKTEILGLLSKLHFGILQSLLAYKSMELNQALFYMPHFVSLSQALMQLNSQGCKSEDTLHLLIEKIGQVIQVAMVTGSLKEEKGKSSNS
uniref:Uncharacterized protein n=1 Tax=Magallana gigas TaxID=29159 RepID=A0A8W8M9B0_MAGGI